MPQIARSSLSALLVAVAALAFAAGSWRAGSRLGTPADSHTFTIRDSLDGTEFFDVREMDGRELLSVRAKLIYRLYGNSVTVPDPSLIYSLAITQREIDRRGSTVRVVE